MPPTSGRPCVLCAKTPMYWNSALVDHLDAVLAAAAAGLGELVKGALG
ncbi:hypothetical protein ACIBF7_11785 [Nonomuraea sp. NPDC050478]